MQPATSPNLPDPSVQERRVFLGWQKPAMPAIADRLVERFDRDFGDAWVVVPTARAGRRLESLLLERRPVLVPPRIATPGVLLDAWTETMRPPEALPIADPLRATLAWVSVLRAFAGIGDEQQRQSDRGVARLAALVPQPPDADDWPGWWSLAQRIVRLREQLAAGLATITDAANQAGGSQTRWSVMSALDAAYLATLDQWGLSDREAARRLACDASNAQAWSPPVFLAALADQTPLEQAAFRRCRELTSFVFADESQAHRFDTFGGLVTSAWQSVPLGLPRDALRVVERRADEPLAVADAIADAAEAWRDTHHEPLRESQVTVGLADETRGSAIVRGIRIAGGSARTAAGRPFAETAPATLLLALAKLIDTERFDALAELVRHPDVEHMLVREGVADADPDQLGWQTLLDEWATRTLRTELLADWLDEPSATPRNAPASETTRGERIALLYRRLRSLVPAASDHTLALGAWSAVLTEALQRLYADRKLKPESAADAETVQALESLADCLADQARLPELPAANPVLTAAAAIRWTLARCASQRSSDPATAGDIEAMGLLDAALDDAPVIVIASANDGSLPGSLNHNGDGLLTDSLRQGLGVPDDARRFARDAYLMTALYQSRASLTLVAARHGNEQEPLKPSRLWLQTDEPAETAKRLLRFYDKPIPGDPPTTPPATLTDWLQAGEANRFVIPRPMDDIALPEKISVTAFRTYLTCPYRFYLTHILRLRDSDDAAVELDAATFGSLLHETLAGFGRAPDAPREATEAEPIAEFLVQSLRQIARRTFGTAPRPAVRVQLAFAEERLQAFAPLQARWTQEGWRIEKVEYAAAATLRVSAGQLAVEGRIDRIDRHRDGGLRIIDFKTGDSPAEPLKQHVTVRKGQRVWADLQLPLYRDLLMQDPAMRESMQRSVNFGYVVLPRKPDETDWRPLVADGAFWAEAAAERDAVITGILTRNFKPALLIPDYADAFSAVCADDWPGRNDDIAQWRAGATSGVSTHA